MMKETLDISVQMLIIVCKVEESIGCSKRLGNHILIVCSKTYFS